MRKILESLLLTVLIIVFGVGGYKLGSRKEKIEVIAAALPVGNAREYGLPTASDIQPATQPIAPTTTAPTVTAESVKPVTPPVVAAKPAAKPVTKPVTKPAVSSPAPQPSKVAQPVSPAPAPAPQPSTKVS